MMTSNASTCRHLLKLPVRRGADPLAGCRLPVQRRRLGRGTSKPTFIASTPVTRPLSSAAPPKGAFAGVSVGVIQGRLPAPPMPRVGPSSSTIGSFAKQQPPKSKWRQWWDDGSILITLGWSGLALLAFDRYLLYQIQTDAHDMMQDLAVEATRQQDALRQQWAHQPALFECVIRREYKNMGGSMGLSNVQVGDVVQVVQERVGPQQSYHLCRITRYDHGNGHTSGSIGWYPIDFMEKVPGGRPADPSNKSLWKRIFGGRAQ
jgi:hypothetical protein